MEQQTKQVKDKNTVFIGKKDFERYLGAVQQIYNDYNEDIKILGRGMFISRTVDVALNKRFENILKLKNVKILAEDLEQTNKQTGEKYNRRISVIEITLERIKKQSAFTESTS